MHETKKRKEDGIDVEKIMISLEFMHDD